MTLAFYGEEKIIITNDLVQNIDNNQSRQSRPRRISRFGNLKPWRRNENKIIMKNIFQTQYEATFRVKRNEYMSFRWYDEFNSPRDFINHDF